MDITGRLFLITGGGSGLGAGTARVLVRAGARVALLDVRPDPLAAVQRELGESAVGTVGDVSSEDSVREALVRITEQAGPLSGVVNCAGIAIAERVLGRRGAHDLSHFAQVVRVNLIGTFNVIRLTAEHMKTNPPDPGGERGVIVSTASVAAFDGQIGQAAYSASKGGVVGMTLPIARELASYGIRVMTIAPGIFDTPMLAGLPEAARLSLGQQVPFPSRLGQPEEYGALVRHILENPMLNGEVIRLDGAIRMAPR